VVEDDKPIGMIRRGYSRIVSAEASVIGNSSVVPRDSVAAAEEGRYDFHDGLLETAVGGMSPRLIRRLKEHMKEGITILDAPPGTACPALETIRGVDICILVLDPSPFGIHDGSLALELCRDSGIEPFVFINRENYPQEQLMSFISENKLQIIGSLPEDKEISYIYSEGGTVYDNIPGYKHVFADIRDRLIGHIRSGRRLSVGSVSAASGFSEETENAVQAGAGEEKAAAGNTREIVIVSGKGGTGKTSVTAAFAALSKEACGVEPNCFVFADCDVDASDLHLVFKPLIIEHGEFSGGKAARIIREKCSGCGACFENCRFEAVITDGSYRIDEDACEGCGVCALVCPEDAISLSPTIDGEWYQSRSRFGPTAHARLHTAAENSGRLVTLVRRKKDALAAQTGAELSLNDGSPGTGCPVIASLTGSAYAVVVTEPTLSGLHDLGRILDVCDHFSIPSGVIINKADINREKAEQIQAVIESRDADFLGSIPFDTTVTEAQIAGLSAVEYGGGPAARALRGIWEEFRARF
jgi:MinD superfamily P-loop ATPase